MEKEYYTISDVSKILNLPPSTIRYWEKKKLISPLRTKTGRRKYTNEHIKLFFEIKKLRYEDNYMIDGVKRYLKNKKAKLKNLPELELDVISHASEKIKWIVRQLEDLKQILSEQPS